jgi:predicted transcriptional regulator
MNPFIISTYYGPDFFCDREKETEQLINAINNGRNTVLYSLRRMGKTGLIRHVFHQLATEDDYYLVYADIDQTDSVRDMVNKLANSLIKIERKSFSDKILDFLKHFRPVFTFHPVTGLPEVEIRSESYQQDESNLETILEHLDHLEKPVVIAIDEFQRINAYPEKNVEGYLRSIIQHLRQVRFIFSGSSRNLLLSMFGDHSRPFYQSADLLFLDRIEIPIYADFVLSHFETSKRSISRENVEECIHWTDNHTLYSQFIFNALWGNGNKILGEKEISSTRENILSSRDSLYLNYRNLLTSNQYQLLRAIALEGGTHHPNSTEFIRKYQLGSASTINSALKTLVDKEMIYSESGRYKLYDVFQYQWFRKKE